MLATVVSFGNGSGMFDEIFGLPVHVLVNHAAVVFVPLAAIAAVLYAVVPTWRWALRWPQLALAAVALGSSFVAVQSGQALLASRPELEPLVEGHMANGQLLLYITIGLFVVALVATFALGGPTRLIGANDRAGLAKPIQIVVAVLLVAVALGSAVQVVRTGDSGARAVWSAAEPSDGIGYPRPAST